MTERKGWIGRGRPVLVGGALVLSLLAASSASAYPRPGMIERVDLGPGGAQAQTKLVIPGGLGGGGVGAAFTPSVSASGRYVAFWSPATNLVPHDVNSVADIFLRDRTTGKTGMVSTGLGGSPAVGKCAGPAGYTGFGSSTPSISADGRYVAFFSCASNLVQGDTNLAGDIFVWDRLTGDITRADVSSSGKQSDPTTATADPSISANGRYVAFDSGSDFVAGKGNPTGIYVYVHDRRTRKTVLGSVLPDGSKTTGDVYDSLSALSATGRYLVFTTSGQHLMRRDLKARKTVQVDASVSSAAACFLNGAEATISATGRYVAFVSSSGCLIPNDSNGFDEDVFVRDMETGRTERVSISSTGLDGNCNSGEIAITPDGRFVSFASCASNWFAGDTPRPPLDLGTAVGPDTDIFTYDTRSGSLEWISRPSDGTDSYHGCVGGQQGSEGPSMSADGRYVAFESCADRLVPHDTNNDYDAFVRDRGPDLGVGGLGTPGGGAGGGGGICVDSVCIPPLGAVSAPDPAGDVNAVLTREGANLIGATLAYRPKTRDLFARLEMQDMPMFALANPALVYGLDLRVHGVRYQVRAEAVAGQALFGLFRRNDLGLWTKVADLRGGYGTTGEEVVFSLPLRDLGLQLGGRLSHAEAFTALGSFDQPLAFQPNQVLDRMAFGRQR